MLREIKKVDLFLKSNIDFLKLRSILNFDKIQNQRLKNYLSLFICLIYKKNTVFNNSIEASFPLKYGTKLKDGRFHSESKVKVKFLMQCNQP
jgi:hypothetical protein